MLVNPAAAERNLLNRVEPVYPEGATALNRPAINTPATNNPVMIRLDIVIARDGHVRTAKIISGDPPFADAARTAVLQWAYRPTLSNGEPVEVRTEVDLTPGGGR